MEAAAVAAAAAASAAGGWPAGSQDVSMKNCPCAGCCDPEAAAKAEADPAREEEGAVQANKRGIRLNHHCYEGNVMIKY